MWRTGGRLGKGSTQKSILEQTKAEDANRIYSSINIVVGSIFIYHVCVLPFGQHKRWLLNILNYEEYRC